MLVVSNQKIIHHGAFVTATFRLCNMSSKDPVQGVLSDKTAQVCSLIEDLFGAECN